MWLNVQKWRQKTFVNFLGSCCILTLVSEGPPLLYRTTPVLYITHGSWGGLCTHSSGPGTRPAAMRRISVMNNASTGHFSNANIIKYAAYTLQMADISSFRMALSTSGGKQIGCCKFLFAAELTNTRCSAGLDTANETSDFLFLENSIFMGICHRHIENIQKRQIRASVTLINGQSCISG